MIVSVIGGLCNRLRALLSYRAAGVREFVWGRDEEICGEHFSDVFRSLGGVTWVDGGAELVTFDPFPRAAPGWEAAYQELHPRAVPMVAPRPYSAIHVRRTDHVGLAKSCGRYTSDEDFRGWLKAAPGPIYIATDNRHTQLAFEDYVRSLGKAPIVMCQIAHSEAQRRTTLHHAVSDLFACAGATHFKGSGESSFSNTVTLLQRLGGWWT